MIPGEWLSAHAGNVRVTVRVVPRSSHSAIGEVVGDALKVRLAAPPVEGAANDELIRLLAAVLDVRRSAVRIVSGEHGRRKVVEIAGIALHSVRESLQNPP